MIFEHGMVLVFEYSNIECVDDRSIVDMDLDQKTDSNSMFEI